MRDFIFLTAFQIRILRICDIEILEPGGTCRILGKYETDEYRAKFKGRSVRVRQFRDTPGNSEVSGSVVLAVTRNLILRA